MLHLMHLLLYDDFQLHHQNVNVVNGCLLVDYDNEPKIRHNLFRIFCIRNGIHNLLTAFNAELSIILRSTNVFFLFVCKKTK